MMGMRDLDTKEIENLAKVFVWKFLLKRGNNMMNRLWRKVDDNDIIYLYKEKETEEAYIHAYK